MLYKSVKKEKINNLFTGVRLVDIIVREHDVEK